MSEPEKYATVGTVEVWLHEGTDGRRRRVVLRSKVGSPSFAPDLAAGLADAIRGAAYVQGHPQPTRPAPRRTARLEVPIGEWIGANDRRHFRATAALTKQLRHDAGILARHAKLEPFDYVLVDAFVRGTKTDPGNLYPTIKAIIDGIVDAKVLRNDTGRQVRAVTMHAPTAGPKSVVIVLTDAGIPKGHLL